MKYLEQSLKAFLKNLSSDDAVDRQIAEKAFRAGWAALSGYVLPIYGAFSEEEYELLLDDLSYWWHSFKSAPGKDSEVFTITYPTWMFSLVVAQLVASRNKLKTKVKRMYLRKKDRIVKKYSSGKVARPYLYGVVYFKQRLKVLGVKPNKKHRQNMVKYALVTKMWPSCAWDIAFSRKASKIYTDTKNIYEVKKYIPQEWQENIEKFTLNLAEKYKKS